MKLKESEMSKVQIPGTRAGVYEVELCLIQVLRIPVLYLKTGEGIDPIFQTGELEIQPLYYTYLLHHPLIL